MALASARRAGAAGLLVLLAALILGGCGGGGPTSPAELALEREDLVYVVRALQNAEGQAGAAVVANQGAWPIIYRGLPRGRTGVMRPQIRAAIEASEHLLLPPLLEERQAAALTGPSSAIAGLYRAFSGLSGRAWPMLEAYIEQIEHGSAYSAAFARQNEALYIDSIYDGQFGLAQVGKKVGAAYRQLGGEKAFGASLTPADVLEVERAYSEAAVQLKPHVGVTFGT